MIPSLMIASVTADMSRVRSTLRASPDIKSGKLESVVTIVKPPNNITLTYNKMLQEQRGRSEYIALVHDDVWLPFLWDQKVTDQIALVTAMDPDWACLGVAGTWYDRKKDRKWFEGHMLDRGRPYRGSHKLPVQVETLDEVCLIIRNDGETRFCDHLASYHLYGAEYCLRMRRVERWSYVIDAYLEHRSENKQEIPQAEFWLNLGILCERYYDMLPIVTNCMSLLANERGIEVRR